MDLVMPKDDEIRKVPFIEAVIVLTEIEGDGGECQAISKSRSSFQPRQRQHHLRNDRLGLERERACTAPTFDGYASELRPKTIRIENRGESFGGHRLRDDGQRLRERVGKR